ncbi:MAG: DUF4124 domain-containing protein [Candidatus Accumulibacter sp.]|nr:DUF4124 domain-containing protein [Accumulibacter sp.]
MMKLFCGWRLAAMLLVTAGVARAEAMYQCIDEEGHKTFSNIKLADKGIKCKALDLGPVPVIPAPGAPAPSKPPKAKSPPDFQVGDTTQKERDNDRRRILESELEAERKNLEQAKKDLAEQQAILSGSERNYDPVLDRLEAHKNKAALHERNIEAIENELAKLR